MQKYDKRHSKFSNDADMHKIKLNIWRVVIMSLKIIILAKVEVIIIVTKIS